MHITQLYILANRIIAPELTEAALEMAVATFNNNSPLQWAIGLAFENLPDNDGFLQMLVDEWCSWAREPTTPERAEEPHLPTSFLFRAVRQYSDLVGRGDQKQLNVEKYRNKTDR